MTDLTSATPTPAPSGPAKIFTGRRKTSVARVRLVAGTGQFTLNGRTLEEYFPVEALQQMSRRPLEVVEAAEKFDVIARIDGGGIAGQAGALAHGIARALEDEEPEWRGLLKKDGQLTRDARKVERKKYGRKKARKAPQYSKR